MEKLILSSLLIVTSLDMLIGEVVPNIFIGVRYIIIFVAIYFFIVNRKKVVLNKIILLIFGILLLSSIQSMYLYLNNGYGYNYLGLLFLVFVYVFPWLILGYNYRDNNVVFLNKVAIIITILSYMYIAVGLSHGKILYGDLGLSYGILPSAMISWNSIRKKINILQVINFILVVAAILFFGSRGPLLCLIVFILLDILKNRLGIKTIVSIVMVIMLGTVAFNFYGEDFSSRTLDKIQNNTLFSDTGRFILQGVALKQIENNPWLGIGIGGERVEVTKEYFEWNENGISNLYPHNFFIEVFADYGVVFGTIFILSYLTLVIYSYRKMRGDNFFIFLLFFCYSFVKLLVSDSYLQNPWFFFSVGYMLNFYDNGKKRNNDEKESSNFE